MPIEKNSVYVWYLHHHSAGIMACIDEKNVEKCHVPFHIRGFGREYIRRINMKVLEKVLYHFVILVEFMTSANQKEIIWLRDKS